MTAEVIHNSVGLATAIAVLTGIKLSARTSTRFPYGLHKVENVVAVGVAGLVFFTAYEIVRAAVLRSSDDVEASAWMLIVLVFTTTVAVLFGQVELRAARAARSPALTAQAREYRVHAATTGLVFASLVAEMTGTAIDRFASIAIVAVVAKTAWDLLRDAVRVLLDASVDRSTLAEIERVIRNDRRVAELRWITGRNAGRFCFVEAGVAIRATEFDGALAVLEHLEWSIRAAVPGVDRVLLHPEASTALFVRYAVPLTDVAGRVSERFEQAPYFGIAVLRRADGTLDHLHVLANPYRDVTTADGVRVADWLSSQDVEWLYTRRPLADPPARALIDAGVRLRVTDRTELADVLSLPAVKDSSTEHGDEGSRSGQ
jgi:cation diffusion facilitator family transporter